jgi:hypothetical protein
VPLISLALDMKAGAKAKDSQPSSAKASGEETDTASAVDESADEIAAAAANADEEKLGPDAGDKAASNKTALRRGDFNLNQFLYMALGALVAYPLGRGSEPTSRPAGHEEPVAMDPSN